MEPLDIAHNTNSLSNIYFYLTPECNLACRHCWIAPKFKNIQIATECIPLPVVTSIIEQGLPLGLKNIKLTGGEPLLHPHILDIMAFARDKGLEVTVETNGTLVSSQFSESLSHCKNNFISVSLDGVDAQTHEWVRGVNGSFEATCNGIKTLTDSGLKPQIIMSLFKRNVDQIESMVQLAGELGAGSVKFNIIQSIGRGISVNVAKESLDITEIIKTGAWVQDYLAKEYDILLFFSVPPAFKALHLLFGEKHSGCASCNIKNILGVLSDGSYALCGIGETIPEMIFGHTACNSLESVWKTHPILNEIREGLPFRLKGICGKCVMRNICLGNCLAQNYCNNHDLWAPYWLCEKAAELNLFPKTRMY